MSNPLPRSPPPPPSPALPPPPPGLQNAFSQLLTPLCSADMVDLAFLWFLWQCVLLQNVWPPLLGSLQLLFLSFGLLNAKCSEVWFSAISYSQNHPQLLFYLSLYVWLSSGHQTWICLGNTKSFSVARTWRRRRRRRATKRRRNGR